MTVKTVEPLEWLRKKLEEGSDDLLREMVREFAEQLMCAEVDAICGARRGSRSVERVNWRNGYRGRLWNTRVGSIDLAIPRLRRGSYYPEWLLEPRKRCEKALISVIVEAYVLGVSTRRVDGLVQTLGLTGISKSQVSELASTLDELVEEFRTRPLTGKTYAYVWFDALALKCREGGRVVNVALLVGVGVDADGRREILGLDLVTAEDGAGWLAFLRGLVARGLRGVVLAISDAHPGLKDAIASVLAGATWQRCRTHFMRNLLTRVPKSAQDLVASVVRTVFLQGDERSVDDQMDKAIASLRVQYAEAASFLEAARSDILAFKSLPKEHWKQVWSTNPQERLNKEIRRRTDVVGIFPNRQAIIRLVGAVLAEQNDEWAVAEHRYMSVESLAKAQAIIVPAHNGKKAIKEVKRLPKVA